MDGCLEFGGVMAMERQWPILCFIKWLKISFHPFVYKTLKSAVHTSGKQAKIEAISKANAGKEKRSHLFHYLDSLRCSPAKQPEPDFHSASVSRKQ